MFLRNRSGTSQSPVARSPFCQRRLKGYDDRNSKVAEQSDKILCVRYDPRTKAPVRLEQKNLWTSIIRPQQRSGTMRFAMVMLPSLLTDDLRKQTGSGRVQCAPQDAAFRTGKILLSYCRKSYGLLTRWAVAQEGDHRTPPIIREATLALHQVWFGGISARQN